MGFEDLIQDADIVSTDSLGIDLDPAAIQRIFDSFLLASLANTAATSIGRPYEHIDLPEIDSDLSIVACLDMNGTKAALLKFGDDTETSTYVLAYRTETKQFQLADKAVFLEETGNYDDWDRLMLFCFCTLLEPHIRLNS